MNENSARDDRALEMRRTGESYAAIARALGFDRAVDAVDAFHRALMRRAESEQSEIRKAEGERLDDLAAGIRAREDLDQQAVENRLSSLEEIRARALTG